MGPSTIRTEAILFLCHAIGETWEMFLKIKSIEKIFYSDIVEKSKTEKNKLPNPDNIKG